MNTKESIKILSDNDAALELRLNDLFRYSQLTRRLLLAVVLVGLAVIGAIL